MRNSETLAAMADWAAELGFTLSTPLRPDSLEPLAAVREMCAADRCRMYGKNWSCPPHCGSLEQCGNEIRRYSSGILLQSVGELEDNWDFAGMQALEAAHTARFVSFAARCMDAGIAALPLGSGCCSVCSVCACPDEPCRFPKRKIVSMEAYGLLVSQVCTDCGVPYYYGKNKLAYTSCVLFQSESMEANLCGSI